MVRFWCISLEKFFYCSKFSISLIQWYKTKLHAIVPNTNYFEPTISKFKTNIYNNNSKIIYMHIHIMFGDILPTTREKFFKICIFRKNASKYAKLMVVPCL